MNCKNMQKYIACEMNYELSNFGSINYEVNLIAEYVPGGSIANLTKNGFNHFNENIISIYLR